MKLDYFPVGKGDTVAVLGAHHGNEALHYSRLVGDSGTVLAVEPNNENFGILRRNVGIAKAMNVICINAAMWDEDGRACLNVGTKSINHSLIKDWKRGTRNVRTVTWDTLVKDVGEIRLANIDIEGAEIRMLGGMTSNLPECVILECHEFFGLKLDDITKPLIEKGYTFIKEGVYLYARL